MAEEPERQAAQESIPEMRVSPRIALALPVLIETPEGQHSARIHNLSRGGALVEAMLPVRTGGHIQFHCGSIEARGTIVWQSDNCFGIKFRLPVDDKSIAQQVARSQAVAQKHEQTKRNREG